jgi:hypothetical protein
MSEESAEARANAIPPVPAPPESNAEGRPPEAAPEIAAGAVERGERRRAPKRRPAGPARNQFAANDDVPSIGGLIFALHQKPSRKPFLIAAAASVVWLVVGIAFGFTTLAPEAKSAQTLFELFGRPVTMSVAGAIVIPITLFWFLALLVWRTQELKLMSSAMTEVAVRLAEPDKMAEQSIASLGQSVRRQVSFINDAIGRAIGRASELEALVHSEVAALERSYSENEYRIRSLIEELQSERAALANNSDRVSDSLRGIGAEVAGQILRAGQLATDSLSTASSSLAEVIESKSGLIAAAATKAGALVDEKLSERGNSLLSSLTVLTQRIGSEVPTVIDRMTQEQVRLTRIIEGAGSNLSALESALATRTQALSDVLEMRTHALDNTMTRHSTAIEEAIGAQAQAIDASMSQHAQAIESSMSTVAERLDRGIENQTNAINEAIARGTEAVDKSVSERTLALAGAMESHARSLGEALEKRSHDLDSTLMRGIDAVRRTSENITRQSVKTIEGLASQAGLLKDVSENLLSQINQLTGRFEVQGRTIMKAAQALETSNLKIDATLQARHSELAELLDKMTERARSFDSAVKDYSSSLDTSLSTAETRARDVALAITRTTEDHSTRALSELERLRETTADRSRLALEEIERLRATTEDRSRLAMQELEGMRLATESKTDRTLVDLRSRLSTISDEVSRQLGEITSRFDQTTGEVRDRAVAATSRLEDIQEQLKDQIHRLPETGRESAEAIRRALGDQLKALEQLSALANRQTAEREAASPRRTTLATLADAYISHRPPESRAPRVIDATAVASIARELEIGRPPAPPTPETPPLPAPLEPPMPPVPAAVAGQPRAQAKGRNGWSLGDLLDRASQDEGEASEQNSASARNALINVDSLATALDPITAADIWTRFRSGERGILTRGVYTSHGQQAFDEMSERYRADQGFRQSVNRYLTDFERLLSDAENKDPGGRIAQNYLLSETGRVYLLLAHASGRLA